MDFLTIQAKGSHKLMMACVLMLFTITALAQEEKAHDKPTRHSVAMEGAINIGHNVERGVLLPV